MEAQIFTLPGVKLKGHKATKVKAKVSAKPKPRSRKKSDKTDCSIMLAIGKAIPEIQDLVVREIMDTAWDAAAPKLMLPGDEPEPSEMDAAYLLRLADLADALNNKQARKAIKDALQQAAVFVLCGRGGA
jgi:hypothetical protein